MCSKGTQDICMVMHFESSWPSARYAQGMLLTLTEEEGVSQDTKFNVSRHGGVPEVVLDMAEHKLLTVVLLPSPKADGQQ